MRFASAALNAVPQLKILTRLYALSAECNVHSHDSIDLQLVTNSYGLFLGVTYFVRFKCTGFFTVDF